MHCFIYTDNQTTFILFLIAYLAKHAPSVELFPIYISNLTMLSHDIVSYTCLEVNSYNDCFLCYGLGGTKLFFLTKNILLRRIISVFSESNKLIEKSLGIYRDGNFNRAFCYLAKRALSYLPVLYCTA